MNFLNPFVLFGLAAATIPLLLHLLSLKRLRTIPFSSLRFLQQIEHSKVRRLRMQQWLLLLVRTLLIVFIVMAFARPTLQTTLPVVGVEQRSSIVILIDNSFSMGISDQGGQRFEQGRSIARSIITSLQEGDEVAVLPLVPDFQGQSVGFTRLLGSATAVVDAMEISYAKATWADALVNASVLLETASNPVKEIILITDGQRHHFNRDGNDTLIRGNTTIIVVPVGQGGIAVSPNFSVDSLKLLTQVPQLGRVVEVEAYVRNHSNVEKPEASATLLFNGVAVSRQLFNIGGGQTKTVVLTAPVQSAGAVAVSVELDPDGISYDNVRHLGFILPPPPDISVLGSPNRVHWVNLALSAGAGMLASPDIRNYSTPEALQSRDASMSVLIVCEAVTSPAAKDVIIRHVSSGGSAVIFADTGGVNAQLLGSMGMPTESILSAGETPLDVTRVEVSHPLFSGVFRPGTDGGIAENPLIKRLLPLKGGETLIHTQLGGLLSTFRHGFGRVLYFAVPPTTEWSSLPMTGLFAATLFRGSYYLSGADYTGITAPVGESAVLDIAPALATSAALSIRLPDGTIVGANPTVTTTSVRVQVPLSPTPGVAVLIKADSTDIAVIAYGTNPVESVQEYVDRDETESIVQQTTDRPGLVVVHRNDDGYRDIRSAVRAGSELWSLFVALALLCVIAEMIVARYFARDTAT